MLTTLIQKTLNAVRSKAPARRHNHDKSPQANRSRNADAIKSVIMFGQQDSTLSLSWLETLKTAISGRDEHVTGLIVGSGFDRMDRSLTAIGFDTVHRLQAINTPRTLLRFETGTKSESWHLSSSEIKRIGVFSSGTTQPVPGKSYRIDPWLNFSDWMTMGSGKMRHIYDDKSASRPDALIFKESVYMHDGKGYDGLSGAGTPDEIILRLRQFGELGLNASTFIKCLIRLASAAEFKINTPTLHSLVTDMRRRAELLRRMAPWVGSNPPFKLKEGGIRAAYKSVNDFHECVPPMAYDLVRKLYLECYVDLDIIEPEDLLVPGKIFHIELRGRDSEYAAFCMKRDVQRLALERPADGTLVVIATENAEALFDPVRDRMCLDRDDIFQCHAVSKPDKLKDQYGDLTDTIINAFPRIFWHTGRSRSLRDLFERLHPASQSARERLFDISHENRLEESGGAIVETLVDLDADGMESSERARIAQLKRRGHRIGFINE